MLTMGQKKAVTAEIQGRHIKATKKDKNKILDEFSATTGYNRVYAARILQLKPGRTIGYGKIHGIKIKYVISKKKKVKRVREKIYGYSVFLALKKIWTIFDFIYSRRLAPFMAEAIEKLTKHKEIVLSPEVKQKLLKVSVSTIDRLLKPEKERYRLGKGRSETKPGSLLKKAIPIRTFLRLGREKTGIR